MKAATVAYLLLSAVLSVHYFLTPFGAVDMLDFAGCVEAIRIADPVRIHEIAYREILKDAPPSVVPHMLGTDQTTNVAEVRRDRHTNPFHFVECLPYFSIKPLYIELIYVINRLGIRMFPAIVLASVLPAFGITLLMWRWTALMRGSVVLLCVFLFVPEVRSLGYGQGPDALSTLVMLAAFILIFKSGKMPVGITLLLASIWVRPDNAIVVLLVLAYLAFRGVLPLWMAGILAAMVFATPVVINHYGGSYGWKALYSHTFKFVEMAPGEFVPVFTARDYVQAVRSGLRTMLDSSLMAYFVLGAIGYKLVPEMRPALLLCAVASVARFVTYPNFEPRYYALFYVLVAISVCTAMTRLTWPSAAR